MTAYDLFQAAQIPTGAGRRSTTGYKALKQLLSEGRIQRTGKGGPLDLCRYLIGRGSAGEAGE